MPPKLVLSPPAHALVTRVTHVVHFYETDAMGIVHHSNYVRFLEHARVRFLAEHDQPYERYVAEGFHVPVTRVEVQYRKACRFADEIAVSCWLAWARHASLGFAYQLHVGEQLVATATTDHAVTTQDGRPVRIPSAMRARMQSWLPPEARS
jgi:acyl-CoA thioester hydrolase